MTREQDQLRLLVPRAVAVKLSRRRFLGLSAAGAAALGLGLAGCGDDGDSESASEGGADGGAGGQLNVYTWAEYTDPANIDAFTSAEGTRVRLDIYESNEAAIAKLELAGGTSGYDIVVPTGEFIPQMVDKGLLQPLDKTKIPNVSGLDPVFLNQPWDPNNEYSVVKDWGSTGYVYDTTVIDEELTDWAGFFRAAAMDGVSGKVSVLEAPGDLTGMVFWREGIDWNTTDPAQLDLAEQVLLDELVPHLKAFNSYPVDGMLDGSYVLAQMWNGDGRTVVIEDPDTFRWVLGGPKTELWIDNWTISAGSKNVEGAHAFIDYLLTPEVSAKEIEFHGYNTAVQGVEDFLPEDLEGREIIFFTDEEKQRLDAGEVTSAQDRIVEIYDTCKAAAAT